MNDEPSFHEAAEELASGMARICRLYGVAPIVGRLYAALFVATRPLSLDELCERVGAAKSTTSVALQKLVRAHVARRLPPRGDRRDYFEAVTDPWAVIADWNRLYFTPELEMFRETGHALEVSLDGRDAPAKEDVKVLRERLAGFRDMAETVSALLSSVPKPAEGRRAARRIPVTVDEEDP
ncbi:MAG: hypothetical protein R3B70_15055 [Polyangiaceae bacterium]